VNLFRSAVEVIGSTLKRWLGSVRAIARRLFRRKYQKTMEVKNYTLGHHLVAFLDVRGQRKRFSELRLPKTAEEETQLKEVLKNTAGFVVTLRELFQNTR
jgi:hypothetical protein